MTTRKKVLLSCLVLFIVGYALSNVAIAETPSPDSPPPPEEVDLPIVGGVPIPAAMIMLTLAVLVVGGLISRTLRRLGVIKHFVWVLLIFVLLTGLAWLGIDRLYPESVNLCKYAKLLAMFSLMITVLYCIARYILPPKASATRAALPPLIRNIAIFALALLGLFMLVTTLFPGAPLAPLFFTSGVVSIVIGLALQETLSNSLAGLLLSMQRPYEVGDWVHINDIEGEVAEVNWRATRLRDRQGDYVEIPNSQVFKGRIVNHHTPTTRHLRKIYIGVTYDTPPGLATQALVEAAQRAQGVLERPAPEVHFRDYQDFSLLFELRVWIDNYESCLIIDNDVRREIWYSFKRHGITIPYPVRDVNFRKAVEPPKEWRARLVATSGLPATTVFALERKNNMIGRDPGSAIHLLHPEVSNEHAIIERKGDFFYLRDLGSRHGTLLNGHEIAICCLQRGDEITIGPITLTFEANLTPIHEKDEHRPKVIRKEDNLRPS